MADTNGRIEKPSDIKGVTLEAWSQGLMTGSLFIMVCITIANMRRKRLLHKLILVELIFGMVQGTSPFPDPPYYGWYLGVGAIFLNTSWSLHNVIAWLKNRPFLSRNVSAIYIGTVILAQPYWVLEITANFLYFNNINTSLFPRTRPWEALARDPWWVYTTASLFWTIKTRYDFTLLELVRVSPRFGVLLAAMVASIVFIILDILSVTHAIPRTDGVPDGINPFWKLAFITKCLTDTVVLDDFKTALDRLKQYRLERLGADFAARSSASGNTAVMRRDTVMSSRASSNAVARKLRGAMRRASEPHNKTATAAGSSSAGGTFASRNDSNAKDSRWEQEVEGLEFCTVPDSVYRPERAGRTGSVSSNEVQAPAGLRSALV